MSLFGPSNKDLLNAIRRLEHNQKERDQDMALKVSQLAGAFTTLADTVDKVKTEVENLKNSLSDVEIPQAAQDALDRLSNNLKAVDDLNPDAPSPNP